MSRKGRFLGGPATASFLRRERCKGLSQDLFTPRRQ